MKKSLFPAVLIALQALSPTIASAQFTDVPASHPYHDAITYAEDQGFLAKNADDTFHPDELVTRAEFTEMFVHYLFDPKALQYCYDEIGSNRPYDFTLLFNDVSTISEQGPELCVALQTGLVHGYPDGSFRPENSINFAEASKVLTRAFRIAPLGHTTVEGKPWYYAYVETMKAHKAVPKSVRSVAQKLTRGEVAQMLYLLKDANPGSWDSLFRPHLPGSTDIDNKSASGTTMNSGTGGSGTKMIQRSIGNYHQRLRAPWNQP